MRSAGKNTEPCNVAGNFVCGECGAQLSNDPTQVHLGVSMEAVEAYGLSDCSEIRGEDAVMVFMCSVCGTRAQLPTVQEIRDSEPEEPVQ